MVSYTESIRGADGRTYSALLNVVSGTRPSGPGYSPYETLGTSGQTLSTRIALCPTGNQVTFLPGTFQFSDFADVSTFGAYVHYTPTMGLRGSGVDSTIFSMVSNTSTKAGTIPAQSTGQTVPLYLIRAGGAGGTTPAFVMSGFTLDGTSQGHIYGGLYVYKLSGGSLTDVKVTGIPGNASSQPGETFSFNDYTGLNNVYTRCTVLGENVAASGFAGNQSTSLTYNNCYATGCHYAHGWAFHIMHGTTTFNDCISTGNGHQGYNFERCDGTIIMNRCDARGNTGAPIAIANDGVSNTGSVRLDIRDPILDASGIDAKVRVKVTGFGSVTTTTQVLSQITVSVGGVNRPDLLQFI